MRHDYERFDPMPDIRRWFEENRTDDPWLTTILHQLDQLPTGAVALVGAAFWAGYERGLDDTGELIREYVRAADAWSASEEPLTVHSITGRPMFRRSDELAARDAAFARLRARVRPSEEVRRG